MNYRYRMRLESWLENAQTEQLDMIKIAHYCRGIFRDIYVLFDAIHDPIEIGVVNNRTPHTVDVYPTICEFEDESERG